MQGPHRYNQHMKIEKVDFHCHTIASKDSLSTPIDVVNTARKRGLTKLVITDHNSIQGALEAQMIAPDFVIIGEEVMTTKGEILASFVKEEIPAGLPPMKVIEELKAQGAFISLSHPFDIHRSGHWKPEELEEMLPHLDAVEGFNARCVDPAFNEHALAFANRHGLPITVGTDSHSLLELGSSYLELPPFTGPESLRAVIGQGRPVQRLSSPLVHLTSRYAVMVKKLQRALG